jgi:two-component system response regulator DegU
MKVLIVEDNAVMREMIKRMVGDLADEISECEDGNQALAAYEAGCPDWVLMDIEMPGMDGITATRSLIKTHPEARVIIVTDYGDKPLRAAARAVGARGYVLKENLIEVRRWLQPSL